MAPALLVSWGMTGGIVGEPLGDLKSGVAAGVLTKPSSDRTLIHFSSAGYCIKFSRSGSRGVLPLPSLGNTRASFPSTLHRLLRSESHHVPSHLAPSGGSHNPFYEGQLLLVSQLPVLN